MHLGPEAHKMIGEGIALDIATNRGDAWFAHEKPEPNKGSKGASSSSSETNGR